MARVIHINDYRTTVAKQAAMHTKSGRKLSEHAAAAKMIRQDLKKTFPTTVFSVKSSSFAGGDSVDISWTDGPTTNQVDALTKRYQYGSFDGMIDLYENTNTRQDIPQAKYVQTQRGYSIDTKQEAVDYVNQRYGWSLRIKEGSTYGEIDPASDAIAEGWGGWRSHRIHNVLHPQPLTCHQCHRAAHVGDDYCAECGTRLTDEHINR